MPDSKKLKSVIYIHQNIKGLSYWPSKESPWDYFTYGWGARSARHFKKYNPDYDVECWRLDSAEKEYCEDQFEDVKFKVYPACGNKSFGIYSVKFIRDILRIQDKIILNVQGVHMPMLYHLLLFKKKNMIITAHHHGSDFSPYFNIKYRGILKKVLSVFYLIIEKLLINRVDFFFLNDVDHIQYLKRTYKNLNHENYILHNVGIDTSLFTPLNKSEARKMIGIDEGKKYLFYVGRFDYVKEVDKLVKIYEDVKKKYPNVQLMVAGGSKDDIYYKDIVNCGALDLGPIMNTELYKYYSAADVYVCCTFRFDYFGGIGTAMIEALACNTPIVSKSLENIPEEKRVMCGKMAGNVNEMAEDIIEVLNSPEKYGNAREVAVALYDHTVIQRNARNCYERLYESR